MNALDRFGLTESQQAVYLSLLRLGEATASQIAKASGVHRTNVYTILDKLIVMGLASEFIAQQVKHFRAAHPTNLLKYLQETQEELAQKIDDLEELYASSQQPVQVEVFHGKKAMKAVFNEMNRQDCNGVGFGIAGQLRKHLPVYAKQFIRDATKQGHTHRYIYASGTALRHKLWKTRTLPQEYISPVAFQVYADKTFITIWQPAMVGIVITSKDVAKNVIRHFELLWEIAQE